MVSLHVSFSLERFRFEDRLCALVILKREALEILLICRKRIVTASLNNERGTPLAQQRESNSVLP